MTFSICAIEPKLVAAPVSKFTSTAAETLLKSSVSLPSPPSSARLVEEDGAMKVSPASEPISVAGQSAGLPMVSVPPPALPVTVAETSSRWKVSAEPAMPA